MPRLRFRVTLGDSLVHRHFPRDVPIVRVRAKTPADHRLGRVEERTRAAQNEANLRQCRVHLVRIVKSECPVLDAKLRRQPTSVAPRRQRTQRVCHGQPGYRFTYEPRRAVQQKLE